MSALLAVLGFVLLLPGICAVPLVLGMREIITAEDLAVILPLLIVFAILFAVGIWLILRAFRTPAG